MELNQEAWELWCAHRKIIKKPIKNEEPAKMKMMRLGDMAAQLAAVQHSAGNNWTGLYAPPKERADPTAPKTRTTAQREADTAQWDYLTRESAKEWDKLPQTPVTRLKLAAALLARYDTEADQTVLHEKREALRDRIAELLREADPTAVLEDFECARLVLRIFSGPGLNRLRYRAEHRGETA